MICASAEELATALTGPEYVLTKVIFIQSDGSQTLTRQDEFYGQLRRNGHQEDLSIECQIPEQPRDSTFESTWEAPIDAIKSYENGNINSPINVLSIDGSRVRTPAWREHPDNKILERFLDKTRTRLSRG